MLRTSALAEKLGLPTASIIGSGFVKQAEIVIKGLNVPLSFGIYPGHMLVDSEAELKRKVEEHLGPALLACLQQSLVTPLPESSEPAPGEVVFRGSYEGVQDYFYERLWSDGLPIVPPTRERVAAFLAYTERQPDESLGIIPQEGREATLHSIALTGVMAGCRAEYMPVLIAIIEAMMDPKFRVEDAGSTPGWEPVVIVSGPIARQLKVHSGQGMMRIGRQANSSIGRFVRLYLRNICGYRIPPGAGDKGSIGQSFLVAMAENEDAVRAMGWPTFGQDQGFGADESVVTVQSVVCISLPTYSAGDRVLDHVEQWADLFGQAFRGWTYTGFKTGVWNCLIVTSPCVAEVIARQWSKDQVREYLRDHITVTVERTTHYAAMVSTPTFNLERLVDLDILPAEYIESNDPERHVKPFIKPEMIGILVAGDPERNQSRGYLCNHIQGVPTSRKVELPRDWNQRIKDE